LEAAGTLELIAELAVAFAGFTGLVGAFRGVQGKLAEFRQELRLLVEYSLTLLADAVLPLFLFHGGLGEEAVWRIASLINAGLTVVYYVFRFRELAENSMGALRIQFAVVVALDLAWVFALLGSALGVLPFPLHTVYLGNLAYMLLGTGLSFLRFISPLWRQPAVDAVDG
jgi:hypothetical protein